MMSHEEMDYNTDSSELLQNVPVVNRHKAVVTVIILITVNLLNYMDRFTLAGIPTFVQQYYSINEEQLGLLQTVFFISYTVLSPLAGYLGDRWHRKYIMLMGLVLWIVVTMISSFVPSHMFYLFLLTRCLVGVGEASYSTIAPTLISDLYVGSARIKVLGFFYFAVPVGSGLGYVVGSAMARWTGEWQWALRVTPILGIVCILILVILHQDPPRGLAEGVVHMETTSWFADLRYLALNPAFMFVSAGFTCVCFILGALTWFAVHLIEMGLNAVNDDPTAWKSHDVPLIFGVGLCISGIVGVLSGAYLGRFFRRFTPKADALICAIAQFICAPILFVALLTPSVSFILCVGLVFVVDMLLCVGWALVSDMTMGVVIPTRRATAAAVQMIMTHALGDCISPAIVGAISVAITDYKSLEMQYLSLQRALFITPFICVLGGVFFCVSSLYLIEAKEKVHKAVEESKMTPDMVRSGSEISVSFPNDNVVRT